MIYITKKNVYQRQAKLLKGLFTNFQNFTVDSAGSMGT